MSNMVNSIPKGVFAGLEIPIIDNAVEDLEGMDNGKMKRVLRYPVSFPDMAVIEIENGKIGIVAEPGMHYMNFFLLGEFPLLLGIRSFWIRDFYRPIDLSKILSGEREVRLEGNQVLILRDYEDDLESERLFDSFSNLYPTEKEVLETVKRIMNKELDAYYQNALKPR